MKKYIVLYLNGDEDVVVADWFDKEEGFFMFYLGKGADVAAMVNSLAVKSVTVVK